MTLTTNVEEREKMNFQVHALTRSKTSIAAADVRTTVFVPRRLCANRARSVAAIVGGLGHPAGMRKATMMPMLL
jgi:hypothetical protein